MNTTATPKDFCGLIKNKRLEFRHKQHPKLRIVLMLNGDDKLLHVSEPLKLRVIYKVHHIGELVVKASVCILDNTHLLELAYTDLRIVAEGTVFS